MKALNTNLVLITELLSDTQYHDGTSIGKQLNITRAAVWKVIKKLEEYAVPLTSIKGKGYRLDAPLHLLNQNKIKSELKHRSVQLAILEKTTSTNDYLKQFIKQNRKIITCLAETQIQGKGRFQRNWYSPFGENLYFSMLYPFEKDVSELRGLSLVIGLAICHAVESIAKLKNNLLKLKWPNDILLDQQKIAGILIEIEAESNGYCQIIVGIGINVNMSKASKKNIDQPWSSLLKATQKFHDRNIICAALIDSLIDYLERFSVNDLSVFIDEWQHRDYLANTEISLVKDNKKITGKCLGINENGHLMIKTADKKILAFSSGDTKLLK